MVDPATALQLAGVALSAAKHALEVGATLYRFCHDARNLDRNMAGFAEEVESLGAACEVVSGRLESFVRQHDKVREAGSTSHTSTQLWELLDSQIHACRATITDLQHALDSVPPRTDSNAFDRVYGQIWRQIRLYMAAPDVQSARNRVRSHTSSLQTILLTIVIEKTSLAQQKPDRGLHSQLEGLREENKELSRLLAESRPANGDSNEVAILRASTAILTDGETLYESSTASRSSINDWDPSNIVTVAGWLHDTNATHRASSDPSIVADVEASSDRSAPRPKTRASAENTPPTTSASPISRINELLVPLAGPLDDDDNTDDDDWRYDAAKHFISTGRRAFKERDFGEAAGAFMEAQKMELELPIRNRKICDTSDFKYMLAVSTFYSQDALSAKAALLDVIQNDGLDDGLDDGQRLELCEAGHLLSQTCVKLSELEEAYRYCDSSLRWRRRMFGKTHQAAFESVALMARILELQGETLRAKFLLSSIPEEHISLRTCFAELKVEPNVRSAAVGDTIAASSKQPTSIASPSVPEVLQLSNGTKPSRPLSTDWTVRSSFEDYCNPAIKEMVRITGYKAPAVLWLGKDQKYSSETSFLLEVMDAKRRQSLCAEQSWTPVSEIGQLLIDGRDEDALRLVTSSAGPRSWMSRHLPSGKPQYREDLMLAAVFGANAVVEALLRTPSKDLIVRESSTRRHDGFNRSPLHYAAMGGSVEVTTCLLKAGAHVDPCLGGLTPLSLAVEWESYAVADILLQLGADPLAPHRTHGSPLHYACSISNLVMVKALAITEGALSTLRRIPVKGKSTLIVPRVHNAADSRYIPSSVHMDPLAMAAYSGKIDVLKYLIARGVSTNQEYDTEPRQMPMISVSALGLAASQGHKAIVNVLLEQDSSAKLKKQALWCAIHNDQQDTAVVLLDAIGTSVLGMKKLAMKKCFHTLVGRIVEIELNAAGRESTHFKG